MSDSWLEIDAGGVTSRVELQPGLTRLGGAGSDVVLEGSPEGEMHVWDDPPKVVFLGASDPPRIDGEAIEERPLKGDELIRWAGAEIRFRTRRVPTPPPAAPPVLEEIPLAPPGAPAQAPAKAAPARSTPASPPPMSAQPAVAALPTAPVTSAAAAPEAGTPDARAWARVRAGMLVEMGLADRRTSARWQESVKRNEFDADACARDVLGSTPIAADDPRLLDRSGRLLRDFLMTPLLQGARGAKRRLRKATKSGAAFLVAQLIVILIYTSMLIVCMILVRAKWDYSFDGLFDNVLGR